MRNNKMLVKASSLIPILIFIFAAIAASEANKCFECSSVDDNYCPDTMSDDDVDIVELKNCAEDLHESMYCVKTTGVTGGWNHSAAVWAYDLHCFVCDETTGSEDFSCSDPEFLGRMRSCKDVFDAAHCIKAEGVWGGSLGTRRFCSSRDLGNYCDYIKRPGDQLEYRSCVYTCTGDGCNGALSSSKPSTFTLMMTISVLLPIFTLHF